MEKNSQMRIKMKFNQDLVAINLEMKSSIQDQVDIWEERENKRKAKKMIIFTNTTQNLIQWHMIQQNTHFPRMK